MVDQTEYAAFETSVMALLHPQFDLYGIDAQNEATDQVDDVVTLARRHLDVTPPSGGGESDG